MYVTEMSDSGSSSDSTFEGFSEDTFEGFSENETPANPSISDLTGPPDPPSQAVSEPSDPRLPFPLQPPAEGQSFGTLEDCVLHINEHAAPRGYAVVLGRTKKKNGEARKAWIICDPGRKTPQEVEQVRHIQLSPVPIYDRD